MSVAKGVNVGTGKPVLGKGLASLFPGLASGDAAATATMTESGSDTTVSQEAGAGVAAASNKDRHPGISMIDVEQIRVNPYQPRREFDDDAIKELSQSIQANGVIQPLVVRKTSEGFQLIAGERRLRAAKLAGLKSVPIVIRRTTDRESLELAIIENVQRQDLNPIDEAMAYAQLLQDFSLTQDEIARRIGKDRATVANLLRLLRLPEEAILALKNGQISSGHGKALLGLEAREDRLALLAEILEKDLSVRHLEVRVAEILAQRAKEALSAESTTPAMPIDTQSAFMLRCTEIGKSLLNILSPKGVSRIEFKGRERRGKIVLHYKSREDLDRLLDHLQNRGLWEQNPNSSSQETAST